MKTRIVVALMGLVLFAAPLNAQEVELREFTEGQRLQRLAEILTDWQAAMIALGESQGMTAEEVGAWVGEFVASKAWLSNPEAVQLMRNWHRNVNAMPGGESEIVASTPESITVRFSRPTDARMGPGGQRLGVSVERFAAMQRALNQALAEGVGVGLEQRVEGDHDVLTFSTGYGDIRAANDIRWARGSYLSWLTFLQLLSMRMESGMTATEVGAADAELYAPSWGAQTPWQLFRGMVRNEMTDPNSECEVIRASADEVHARCREHYLQMVTQNESRFGVTAQDVFDSGMAFRSGVAEHLGLRWVEEREDGWRIITVTKR